MMTFTNTCVYILEKLCRRVRYTRVNLKEVSQTSFIDLKISVPTWGKKNPQTQSKDEQTEKTFATHDT